MSTVLVAGLGAAALLTAIGALVRAVRNANREITAWQRREHTANRVLDDARAWRSARDLKTCRAIWPDAPHHIPQQQRRKETGQ